MATKYYATGVQKTKTTEIGEDGKPSTVYSERNVRLELDPLDRGLTRVQAVNEADRQSKRQKIRLDGVYAVQGTQRNGELMTKNMRKQRQKETLRQQATFRKRLAAKKA